MADEGYYLSILLPLIAHHLTIWRWLGGSKSPTTPRRARPGAQHRRSRLETGGVDRNDDRHHKARLLELRAEICERGGDRESGVQHRSEARRLLAEVPRSDGLAGVLPDPPWRMNCGWPVSWRG